MRSSIWIDLVRRVPLDQHNSLLLVTTIGQEFNLQAIVRTEEEYLIIRGRMAGTTDSGRVFFIPYDQINYMGFQNEVKEAQIRALYGEPEPAAQQPEAGASLQGEAATPPDPVPPAKPETAPVSPRKSSGRLPIPSKRALLERLRLRNRDSGNTSTPSSP
jgi:hypothetical protein